MSKKSRKRNRKILKVLAAGLGAAALMRGRKGAVSTVGQPVGVDRMSPSQPPIGGTDHIPVAPKKVNVAPVSTSKNLSRMQGHGPNSGVVGQGTRADYVRRNRNAKLSAMNAVPPSMRGGAEAAQGYLRRLPGQRHYKGGWTDKPGGWSSQFKKGGRVKLAKRGLGRAFTKNKK